MPKLSIEDLLRAMLEYLREYHTYAHIAASYGIAECNIYRGIKWVEDTLIEDGTFSLPGRKAPLKSDMDYEVILVDATESPIERPKKAKRCYPGKKKRHTLKTQMLVNLKNGEIICLAFTNRKKHDFRLFKDFRVHVKDGNFAGSGYRLPTPHERPSQLGIKIRLVRNGAESATLKVAGEVRLHLGG